MEDLKRLNDRQEVALKIMQDAAAKLNNDLRCGATFDTQKYINAIQKALKVYDDCHKDRLKINNERENGITKKLKTNEQTNNGN